MGHGKVQTPQVSIHGRSGKPGELMNSDSSPALLGVIEGFYGRPWTPTQRQRLFALMRDWGMNTYLYAPKEDLKHRRQWREHYTNNEALTLEALVHDAHEHDLAFVYALAPGLDIVHSRSSDRAALVAKLSSVAALGVRHFALLFDDIPSEMNLEDRQTYAGLAEAQADVSNLAVAHLRSLGLETFGDGVRLLFCPTEYCARQANPSVTSSPYLRALGEHLEADIGFFWTGPEVISPQITAESIRELAGVIRRKPVLWDNLHANDYAPRRVHLGPYDRPLDLREEVSGILSNPNTPFEVNYPSLASLADYAHATPDWTPRASVQRAITAWSPHLELDPNANGELGDLALLVDALYLPHVFGEGVSGIVDAARAVLQGHADTDIRATLETAHERLERLLRGLAGGGNREACYELYPYLIELVDELSRLRHRASGHPELAFEPFPRARPGSLVDELRA
jgi:beta-N-acetylglucosaminidase